MLYFLNCVVEQITKQDIILGVSTVPVYEYGVSSFSERPAYLVNQKITNCQSRVDKGLGNVTVGLSIFYIQSLTPP